MGNRASVQQQPAPPPALLTAAVMGDLDKFQIESKDSRSVFTTMDRQDNNVLHALFSCRAPDAKTSEILDLIHGNEEHREKLLELYAAKNNLGCTPLWILVAYGNVPLLKEVQSKLDELITTTNNSSTTASFADMLLVPNNQGDSPLLATCSQGSTDMVRFLKDDIFSQPSQQQQQGKEEAAFTTALLQANTKGTTPLQIVIGNAHMDLLNFLLQQDTSKTATAKVLLQKNAAGLSLFHICSERNFDEGLRLLLEHTIRICPKEDGLEQVLDVKDKNNANALHVAAFCGNKEVVEVWIDVIQKTHGENKTKAVELLDRMDGESRTAYWLAMVQGKETIGEMLAAAGVETTNSKMVKEIEEAKHRRVEAAKKREQQQASGNNAQPVDGAALLGQQNRQKFYPGGLF